MIDFYATVSPTVLKVAIMLEEVGQPYRGHYVDIMRGGNFAPEFLAMNPIAKLPVLVDHDGDAAGEPIFETGAILIYLGDTYGPALLPRSGPARWAALKWMMFQVAVAGPMLGQLNHFQIIKGQSDTYAAGRYRDQAARVFRNVEDRLAQAPYLGGENYSIADIAMYPWSGYLERQVADPEAHPHLIAWRDRIGARPQVSKAREALKALASEDAKTKKPPIKSADVDRFFGRRQSGQPAADFPSYYALGPVVTL